LNSPYVLKMILKVVDVICRSQKYEKNFFLANFQFQNGVICCKKVFEHPRQAFLKEYRKDLQRYENDFSWVFATFVT